MAGEHAGFLTKAEMKDFNIIIANNVANAALSDVMEQAPAFMEQARFNVNTALKRLDESNWYLQKINPNSRLSPAVENFRFPIPA